MQQVTVETAQARSPLVRLSWLIKAQEISETLATPHRLFDAAAVKSDSGHDDPFVVVKLIFVEFSNTGIRSPLERFVCTVLDDECDPTSVTFQVDLIEGLLDLSSLVPVCSEV